MAEPAFSVCVYCGSRPGDNPAYTQVAQAVGQWIGAHQGQLVYGGGRSGLMGTVAEATRLAGGRVVGIMPRAASLPYLEALGLVAVRLDETWAEHQLYLCRRTDSPLPPAAARLFAHLADTATVQA